MGGRLDLLRTSDRHDDPQAECLNSEDAKYRDKVGKEAAALRKPGSKKSRRMELEPRALALYEELGSERKVARALNVALSTVYYWVKTRDDQRPNL